MPDSKPLQKVLIANRGEIAVRVIRACKDAGIGSVAVYADPDRDALFVRIADEGVPLEGSTPAESYLDIDKIIEDRAPSPVPTRCTPATGSSPRTPGSPRPCSTPALVWIGPRPRRSRTSATRSRPATSPRRSAPRWRRAPRTPSRTPTRPSSSPRSTGCRSRSRPPSAAAAAASRSPATMYEVADAFDSAVREAVGAFGRGECFVEKFLDQPRHVETQCLADQHGNVVVVSTRDCSLQRRHQKLVEEAPARSSPTSRSTRRYESSKAILREAGYVGAGREFLVDQDGTISFLEVNTRLQVEHPRLRGGHRPRPGPRDVPDRRRRGTGTTTRGPRPLDRVPDQRRGRRPQLHACPRHPHPVAPPVGPRVRLDGGYDPGETIPARSTRSSPS